MLGSGPRKKTKKKKKTREELVPKGAKDPTGTEACHGHRPGAVRRLRSCLHQLQTLSCCPKASLGRPRPLPGALSSWARMHYFLWDAQVPSFQKKTFLALVPDLATQKRGSCPRTSMAIGVAGGGPFKGLGKRVKAE